MSRVAASAFALGCFSLLAQTVLARELLPLFHGSELSLGLVLAAWLLLAGLGSHVAGRAAGAAAGPGAVIAAAAVAAVAFPAAVVAARSAGAWLPVPHGTVPGLRLAALAVGGVLAAVAAPCGAWYALAAGAGGPERPGRVYAWEAAGGLAAGALFTGVLAGRVDGFVTAAGASALLLAAAGWAAARTSGARGRLAGAALAAAALLLAAAEPLGRIADRSRAARWRGFDVAAAGESRFGPLALVRNADQFTLFASGAALFSFPDEETAEAAAHLPLLAAPAVGRVLVAGGGVGGVLAEVLKHPVREVDYVELDPAVLPLVRPHLPAPLAAALAEPRVRTHLADLRVWVAAHPGRYDAILLGTPEPVSAAANRLATREFFDLVRRALAPGGVAALSLPSSPNFLGPRLRLRNASVRRALLEAFPRVELLTAEPLALLASAAPHPLVDAGPMAARLAARGLATRTITPETIRALVAPERAAFAARELDAAGAAANRDLEPVAYFHHLRYREALEDAASLPAPRPVPPATRWALLAAPLLLAAAALLPGAAAARRGRALGVAAATTGFAAMALQYLTLFVYQESRGGLYGALGALAAAFMAGLAGGAFLALRRLARGARPLRLALAAEVALAASPAAAALGFLALRPLGSGAHPAAADAVAAGVALLCGAVAGFEFPLFAPASAGPPAAVGARSYALDLGGAAAGALATSLWALPLLGLWWTLAFLGSLKLGSLLLLRATLARDG